MRAPVLCLEVRLGERRLDPIELKRLAGVYGKPVDFF